MAYQKPTVLPAWGEANQTPADMIQPSNGEIQMGWPKSSTPPSRQRFNWLFFFLANGIRYFMQRGIVDYDPAETYMTNARIIGDDGNTYVSISDNNIANTPSTSPGKWTRWGFTAAQIRNAGRSRQVLSTDNGVNPNLDCATYDEFEITVNADCNPTVSGVSAGQLVTIIVIQGNGGNHAFNFPNAFFGHGDVDPGVGNTSIQNFKGLANKSLHVTTPMMVS